jgi:hypothetical protein
MASHAPHVATCCSTRPPFHPPPPTPRARLGHPHEGGHHAVHVGAAVRDGLLGAGVLVVRLQHAVECLELQRGLLLQQLRSGGVWWGRRCGVLRCGHWGTTRHEVVMGRARLCSCGRTWKDRHTTTGAPTAVLNLSLICALTSVSPATLGSWMNDWPLLVLGGSSPVHTCLRHSMMVCKGVGWEGWCVYGGARMGRGSILLLAASASASCMPPARTAPCEPEPTVLPAPFDPTMSVSGR